jgi:hypothetical protein
MLGALQQTSHHHLSVLQEGPWPGGASMPLIKHHVFRFYGWYALVFALLGLTGYLTEFLKSEVALPFLGGVFSFIFLVQKQKLAETSFPILV